MFRDIDTFFNLSIFKHKTKQQKEKLRITVGRDEKFEHKKNRV